MIREVLIYAVAFLAAFAASLAGGAECGNCLGRRVVGPGPVRYACPVCDGTGVVADEVLPEAAEKAAGAPRRVVCRVEAADGPSRVSGSGVLVAASGTHGIVVTNWHVVRSHRDDVRVHWPSGEQSPARVLQTDDAWDLAALLVTRPDVAPVTIAAKAPTLGERLTIAGYGMHPYTYREESGACLEYLSPARSHAKELVEMRATARKGDSGGPMFDERGELAGVLFGTRDGCTIGPCSTRVRTFLAGVQWPAEVTTAKGRCADGRCAKR